MPARPDPYRNFNFVVDLGGEPLAMFEVILPVTSIDVVEYREGGDPTNAVRKLTGLRKFTNLVLKRGISESRDFFDWLRRVSNGQVDRRDVTVTLLDESQTPVKRWVLRNAWPVRYEVSRLQAAGHDVVLETLEIAVEDMELA